ncbi:hypothetical protein [Streptacidiphilus cavernicola]|uniref:Uncharacterized protein n=1 Tax=Streptacidiphilus cavernicola TaxID=3342716 RepID=A0ABV6VWX1_9ACTN
MFTTDPVVLRTLVVAASVGAFAGAVLLRLREHAGEAELEAEIAARGRDEARFEDRAAELEAQAEAAEEQVKRLERRLLAQRAQITRTESENARLLRDRARIAAEAAAREAEEARRREAAVRGTRPSPTAYLKAAAALRGLERRAAVGQAQRIAAAQAPQGTAVYAGERQEQGTAASTGEQREPGAAVYAGEQGGGTGVPAVPGLAAPLPSALDALAAARQHPAPAEATAATAPQGATASASAGTAAQGVTGSAGGTAVQGVMVSAAAGSAPQGASAAAAPQGGPVAGGAAPSGSTASGARSGATALSAPAGAVPQVPTSGRAAPAGAAAPAWARAALPPMRPASAVLPTALVRPARQSRDLLRKEAGSGGTFNFFSRQEAAISRGLGDLADVVGDEAAAAQQLYAGDPVATEAAVGALPDPVHGRTDAASADGAGPGTAGLVDLTADDETEPIDVRALRAI